MHSSPCTHHAQQSATSTRPDSFRCILFLPASFSILPSYQPLYPPIHVTSPPPHLPLSAPLCTIFLPHASSPSLTVSKVQVPQPLITTPLTTIPTTPNPNHYTYSLHTEYTHPTEKNSSFISPYTSSTSRCGR
jgi:hypothetical protein